MWSQSGTKIAPQGGMSYGQANSFPGGAISAPFFFSVHVQRSFDNVANVIWLRRRFDAGEMRYLILAVCEWDT